MNVMHLSAEDLLKIIQGDTGPRDLDEQLAHMDHCRECADAFALMVDLRAYREEALEALSATKVEEAPVAIPFRTPAQRVGRGWANPYLRLAATVAVAAILAIVVWTSPIMQRGELAPNVALQAALTDLTVDEFVETIGRPPSDAVQRAGQELLLEEVRQALLAGRPELVIELLADAPSVQSDADYFRFYGGVAHYLNGQPEQAVAVLESLGEGSDSAFLRQACWFRANALLRLGRIDESLDVLDDLALSQADAESLVFGTEAAALASEIRALLPGKDTSR